MFVWSGRLHLLLHTVKPLGVSPAKPMAYLRGSRAADLALGWFGRETEGMAIPQVLREFKDIRTSLDKEQFHKGNNRLSGVVYLKRFTLTTKLMFNLV